MNESGGVGRERFNLENAVRQFNKSLRERGIFCNPEEIRNSIEKYKKPEEIRLKSDEISLVFDDLEKIYCQRTARIRNNLKNTRGISLRQDDIAYYVSVILSGSDPEQPINEEGLVKQLSQYAPLKEFHESLKTRRKPLTINIGYESDDQTWPNVDRRNPAGVAPA